MLQCGLAESQAYETEGMQDRSVVHCNLIDNDRISASWLAVYDGHGGDEASEYLKRELHFRWKRNVGENLANLTERTLKNTFLEVDTRMCSTLPSMSLLRLSLPLQSAIPQVAPGCTAAVAILIVAKDTGKTFVQTANCGDAQILWIGGDDDGPEMMTEVHTGGDTKTLGLTRCFGNPYLKKLLTPDPHCSLRRTERDATLVLATKGLWNVVGPDRVANVVKEEADPRMASSRLCNEAIQKGSHANVSIIVANIRNFDANRQNETERR